MQNWQTKLAFWQQKSITRRASLFILGYSLVVSTSLLSCGTQKNQTQSQTNSPVSSNPTSSTASTPTSTNKVGSKNNPQKMAQMLAPVTQLDAPTLVEMHKKYEWGLQSITEEVITKQQEVADKWYKLGLIPKQVNVKVGFLSPQEYAEFTPKEVLASQQ